MTDLHMKPCTRCGDLCPGYSLGLRPTRQYLCRNCHAEKTKRWKSANRARYLAYSRTHSRPTHPQKKRSWRVKDRLKLYARNAVYRAVRSGRLVKQPCMRCGRLAAHAHHKNYSRRLDVIWLCSQCHGREHWLPV